MELSKDLSEALAPDLKHQSLLEASLGRIWQHGKENAFVLVTAWRANLDLATNQKNMAALKKLIRADGYGFIPIEGVGQEEGGTESKEPSLFVISKSDPDDPDGDLLKDAIAWAKKYDQYAIFYHVVRDGKPLGAVINVAAGAPEPGAEDLSTFTPNKMTGFYSKLRKGGSFKYEWMGVKFADPAQSWIVGMGLEAQGQVRFDLCETRWSWLREMGLGR